MASAEPIAGRCAAVVKPRPEQDRPGGFCTRWPMLGQTRCWMHGGAAKQNRAAAARNLAEAEAKRALATYGRPVTKDWVSSIRDELNRTNGHIDWLNSQIAALDPAMLTWSKSQIQEKLATEFPGIDTTEAARIHGLLELYHRERTHLDRQHGTISRLDVGAVETRIAEQAAAAAWEVIEGLLGALGLSMAEPRVSAAVHAALGALPPGTLPPGLSAGQTAAPRVIEG